MLRVFFLFSNKIEITLTLRSLQPELDQSQSFNTPISAGSATLQQIDRFGKSISRMILDPRALLVEQAQGSSKPLIKTDFVLGQ